MAGPIQEVLDRLHGVAKNCTGYTARCPSHDDDRPSLTVSIGADGRVLLHCHAGCSAEEVVRAVGLKMADLYPRDDVPGRLGPVVETYDYRDEAGVLLFQVTRHEPKDFRQRRKARPGDDPAKVRDGWFWGRGGAPLVLYRLPELLAATPDQTVFVAEGEKDVESLRKVGLVATTNPGGVAGKTGGRKWLPSFNEAFRGRRVVILPDNDGPGRAHAETVRRNLEGVAAGVAILELPGLPSKGDVSDWFLKGGTAAALLAMADRALSGRRTPFADPPPPPPGGGDPPSEGLHTTRLSDLLARPLKWLVPKRIPAGKLVMFFGDGGHGKSRQTLDMAADLSRGRPLFGLGYQAPPPCDTLLISCEDGWEDTIIPRLLATGADLGRIHRVDGVLGDGGEIKPFDLACYQAMRAKLEAHPEIRLVIIDPAGAFVGRTGIDDHKDSELRSLLGPMSDLAEHTGVTIVLVKHINRNTNAKAIQRVSGSSGYANAVRAVFAVLPDKDDETLKLLLPAKFNLGPWPSGLKFRMVPLEDERREAILAAQTHLDPGDRAALGEQLYRVDWLGETDVTADDAMESKARRERGPRRTDEAADWLRGFLKVFAYPSEEIVAAARKAGFTFDNVKEAKALLKAEGLQNSNRAEFQGKWWSGFGNPASWQRRPEPGTGGPTGEPSPLTPPTPFSPQSPHYGQDHSSPPPPDYHINHSGESGERRGNGESGESGERETEGGDDASWSPFAG